jgi:heptaprenylglyceryl phosphate synthase
VRTEVKRSYQMLYGWKEAYGGGISLPESCPEPVEAAAAVVVVVVAAV